MLRDFTKLNTFLTVVREKSFSKASAKIGVSQPAVTQQIRFIEEYLSCKILERKKNGIILTKEGNELYRIALKVERCLNNADKELLKIVQKNIPLKIGASMVIGSYILPQFSNEINKTLGNDIVINVAKSKEIIDMLLQREIDVALIEAPIFEDGVYYREWIDDEIVLFSNEPLPKYIKPASLDKYDWYCREEGSHTRELISNALESVGIDCESFFKTKNILSDATAVKQTILKKQKDGEQAISVISKFFIEDEVKEKKLFISKLRGFELKRKTYIAYLKENKHDPYIQNIVSFLMKQKISPSI
jgi:DNA-binding transcriptional LysR family regulator